MDKIAVISDVHGNIPAFDAVLEDIAVRDVKTIICLGDMVGKGPHSDIAVDKVKEACSTVVMGNWDDFITKPTEIDDLIWHQKRLGEERFNYLRQLPFCYDFVMSGKLIRLFHASPESVYKRIQPWDPLEDRLAMFNNTERTGMTDRIPDTVGYGDIHNAYVQHIKGKTLFNVGSVGNPLDLTQASYAILEGVYQSEQTAPFSIQLVRVPYDIELSIHQAREADMPLLDPYIRELRTGKYRGIKD